MKINELLTKNDLTQFEIRINRKLEQFQMDFESKKVTNTTNFLRTSGVKKLLKVSNNKLKTMRENGEIPYSFIASTYYYPEGEILEILKNNTINKLK